MKTSMYISTIYIYIDLKVSTLSKIIASTIQNRAQSRLNFEFRYLSIKTVGS